MIFALRGYTYIYIYKGLKSLQNRLWCNKLNISYILKTVQKSAKKRVKKLRKSLEIKNKALPLHPQSRDTRYRLKAARFLDKNFLKKVFEKFGGLK